MAFTDDDIRALVETGQYSDPAVVDYLTRTLSVRRDKIGKAYFSKVLPLDHFTVSAARLHFEDLAVKCGFSARRPYKVSWTRFDNKREQHAPLPEATSFALPDELKKAEEVRYFAARIHSGDDTRRNVVVYLRKRDGIVEVAGVERGWPAP